MFEFINKMFTSPLYWIICISLIIICKYGYAKIIGWAGEHWVRKELKKLPKDKYKIINNVMINVNGKTCQIDHIVFSNYGIFVIETKQYNGYFTGGKYDKKWVSHFKNGKTCYYTNPIRQNYGHVKSICELLNINENQVFNIVCISSRAKLNIQHDGELTTNLTIVEKIISYKDVVIDNVEGYYQKLFKANIKSKRIRKKHNKDIKNNMVKFDYTMCPRCGGKLVDRDGKNGPFIGCSNYPKCTYTKSIDKREFL